ncbi:MAG: TetR family transcriptional regulator [Clostridia bacterium]|nr:TetR family transcriptional regulator [Clostridia bacterium]
MEDKRILKTKKNLKSALIALLGEFPFEKISVTELCRKAKCTRVTFYTYYEDKYALAEELFIGYIREADDTYHRLQEENNPENDALKGYVNLLESILCLYFDNSAYFIHATQQRNPYLFSSFYSLVFESVDDYIDRHRGLVPKYPSRQTASVLCSSMFGLINTCVPENLPEPEVRAMARDIYLKLLRSGLFTLPGSAPL